MMEVMRREKGTGGIGSYADGCNATEGSGNEWMNMVVCWL